ncbi:YbaN family protein [Treponema sp.]
MAMARKKISKTKKVLLIVGGWIAFALGWMGVFLPGLPTTIFWILAALAFLRTNEKMYQRIIGDKRFGASIKLFVEEGKISLRGKWISISAMMVSVTIGIFAIPLVWVKLLVVTLALIGSVVVYSLPSEKPSMTLRPKIPPVPSDQE